MAEQFINTFEGGMNKDFDPTLQPKGTYRDAKNCTLISQSGNNYVIKDCLGNVLTFQINIPYDATYPDLALVPMPIGFVSFPNRLIVFSTNDEATGGYLEIGEIKYLPYGQGIQPQTIGTSTGYVPLYHSAFMNGTRKHRIEGIGMPESDSTQRVYWTDNNSEPRVLKVSDARLTTYIPSGSLGADGSKYMVIQGAIEYPVASGDEYGPGLTLGNIIEVTGGNVTYTSLSSGPKVIENIPYELLSWTPDRKLGSMYFDGYGTGSVNCGSKVYFFRYGLNESGYFTPWSYPSGVVHVGTDNTIITTNDYTDAVGAGTDSLVVSSTKSVKILIDNIDVRYDIIQLAAAEYDNLSDVIRLISIVDQENVLNTDTEIVLEHAGDLNLGSLTIDDVTLFPVTINKLKTLDTNKNYLLIGNISEREELSIPASVAADVTLSSFEYEMPSYSVVDSVTDFLIPDISCQGGVNPTNNIVPESHWVVTDASGGSVEYPVASGIFYAVNETFVGLDTFDTATIPGTSQVRPCIVKKKYTTNGAVDVYNIIQMKNGSNFWDYKDPLVHQELTGHWGTETYRYAAIYFDLKGNPYYARHIGDFAFPNNTSKGGLTKMHEYQTAGIDDFLCLNPSGLNVSGLTIPAADIDKISGFSIVRAIRDPRVVTQGLVTQCTANAGIIYNGAYIPISYDLYGAGLAGESYVYLSPDLLCEAPLKAGVGVVGDKMESACWLDCVDFSGAGLYTSNIVNNEQAISKVLYSLTGDTGVRTETINFWNTVLEGADTVTSGTDTFDNTMQTQVAATPSGLADGRAVGGKKIFFSLEADFDHYGVATGYTANANNGMQEKLLMNYVKANAGTPYGGTGAVSLANTLYISTGHYQEINDTIKGQVIDGNGDYTFNNIEVWGGDCYINMIDYGYGLWNVTYTAPTNAYSYGWQFPCECNSNYNLRRGSKQTNVGMYYTGTASTDSIVYLTAGSAVRLENFQYNKGYSTEGQSFLYPALPINFINENNFKARVRYAGPKFINEIQDSFRTFLTNDYKDLDVQQGRINCIKVREGRVFVWQDLALNTVPVLERQILSGLPGSVTTLGTGGVVDRFDPISTYYGSQHQWSVIPTEFGFVYFDMRHKAMVAIDGSINEISYISGMNSFFNEIFNEVAYEVGIVDADLILDSPTFADESDMPLIGVGITGVYDPKFKMTYITFKFYLQRTVATFDSLIKKDFTVGYYHPNKCFIGFFAMEPAIAHNHNGFVLMANDPKNKDKYYGPNMAPTTFSIGDTASKDNVEYICILGVTLDNYPPTDPAKDVDYVGSIYWTVVNKTNQIWVLNQPRALNTTPAPDYQYNMFFGKVVTNELEFVVNPQDITNDIAVLNMEQDGNLVNVTDVYIESETETASDLSISSTSRMYSSILSKICSSLPLSSGSRIIDSFLKIKLVKKNYTASPTALTGAVRLLRQINTFFEQKR